MPNPQTPWTMFTLTSLVIYPWNSAQTYNTTNQEVAAGLQTLGISHNSKLEIGRGGESVHPLVSAESERDTEVKFSALSVTMRFWSLITGDTLTVDLSDGNGPEMHYMASPENVRTPYFRLEGQTNVSDPVGGLLWVRFPKVKLNGNFAYDIKAGKVNIPEAQAIAFWDSCFQRSDGVVGGAYDYFWSATSSTTLHS